MNFKLFSTSYYARVHFTKQELKKGKKLLNAGCGEGDYNYYLTDKFEEIISFDINKIDVNTAKLNSPKNCKCEVGIVEKIKYTNESFDSIICLEVIEHLKDERKALKELYRVLKKEGQLIISVPHSNYPFLFDPINYILEKITKKHLAIGSWSYGHTRLYTRDKIEEEIKEAGFKIEKTLFLTHDFTGMLENYIPMIMQPIVKNNSKNNSQTNKNSKKIDYKFPKILDKMMTALTKLDATILKKREKSIGLMIIAKK